MYKLHKNDSGEVVSVTYNGMGIPFDPANVDFQNFKKEVLAGAELFDADGNVMTDSVAYVRTLP